MKYILPPSNQILYFIDLFLYYVFNTENKYVKNSPQKHLLMRYEFSLI